MDIDKTTDFLPLYKKEIIAEIERIDETEIKKVIKFLWVTYKSGDPIFIIGNGGSAANASHFAQDLVKGTYPTYHGLRDDRFGKAFKAISLVDNISFITATSNDDGYEYIFVNQLKSLANKDSLLIAISGSGNSPNVLSAVRWCNLNKIPVMSFTGGDGGELKKLSTLNVNVYNTNMMHIETIHSFMFHYIIEQLKWIRVQDGQDI